MATGNSFIHNLFPEIFLFFDVKTLNAIRKRSKHR